MSHARSLYVVLVLGCFGVANISLLAPSNALAAPTQVKGEERPKAQNGSDLRELQQVFGNSPVTILYGGGAVEGVRIIDVVEIFGSSTCGS